MYSDRIYLDSRGKEKRTLYAEPGSSGKADVSGGIYAPCALVNYASRARFGCELTWLH